MTRTWNLRSETDLVVDQIAGISAWTAAVARPVPASGSLTREMRLDLARQEQARQRERAAVLERAREQLERSGRLTGGPSARPRALVVHRDSWLRGKVALGLQELGVWVVGSFEDGADAAGALVVEQPEMLFVEDRLPTLTGLQVLERARDFAPRTVTGVQLADIGQRERFLQAGARAVFPRRLRPHEIADELLGALQQQDVLAS